MFVTTEPSPDDHTPRVNEPVLASPALVDGTWYFRTHASASEATRVSARSTPLLVIA